jgi:hypothetical protein
MVICDLYIAINWYIGCFELRVCEATVRLTGIRPAKIESIIICSPFRKAINIDTVHFTVYLQSDF